MDSKIAAELLKNLCQVKSCSAELDQYDILCPRHWGMVPLYLRRKYWTLFKRLHLDQRLDRTSAWAKSVKKLGTIEASDRLADYRLCLKRIESAIEDYRRNEICQKIKNDKWDGEKFNEAQP